MMNDGLRLSGRSFTARNEDCQHFTTCYPEHHIKTAKGNLRNARLMPITKTREVFVR